MARILNSPNQSVASEQLVLLESTKTKIKQLILRGASAQEIQKVINDFCSKFKDVATQRAFKRALDNSTSKMMYQYNYNVNIMNQSFINKVVKSFNLGTGTTLSNKSYTIDLNAIYNEYVNKNIGQRQVVEEFRNKITDAKKGLAIIKNYDKQVVEQTKLLASEPVNYVDKRGRAISLRNKVEMATRYAANQNDLSQYKASGVKLVWTSSHADASPRCSPFQGKLWSLDGSSGTIDGHSYKPIETALNANGGNSIINGYNCRHYLIEYEKGSVAPKDFTSKEIQKEYKIDQKQRQYENRIRQLKIEETLLRQQGFDKEASRLRKSWQNLNKRYEDFSKANNRAFYPWRTRISEEERERKIGKLDNQNESGIGIIEEKPIITKESYPNSFLQKKKSIQTFENLSKYINSQEKANPKVVKLYSKLSSLENIESNGINFKITFQEKNHEIRDKIRYSKEEHTIKLIETNLKINALNENSLNADYETNLHEIGHLIDLYSRKENDKYSSKTKDDIDSARKVILENKVGMSDEVDNLFKESNKSYKKIKDEVKKEYNPKFDKLNKDYDNGLLSYSNYRKEWKKTSTEYSDKIIKLCDNVGTSGLEDIYDALSRGKNQELGITMFGHGTEYFSQDDSIISEIFANYLQLNISKPDLVEMLKRDKPSLCNYLDKLIDEIIEMEEKK